MSARTPNRFAHSRKGRTSPVVWVLILMSSMLLGGIIFTIFAIPAQLSSTTSAYTTNSMLARANQIEQSISAKIMSWVPHKSHAGLTQDIEDVLPDWDNEDYKFWTPIDLDTSYPNDPTVTLCHLNFKEYANAPHLYPMFRDLETASSCNGNNKRKVQLSVLMNEIKENEGNDKLSRVIKPNAFVFHESRVGSTLVANTLGSDPWALVFSESAPAASALLHCAGCSRQKNVQLFRDIVTLMGRSPFHQRLFFKFQSITSTKMDIALEAFPDTPWMFVYRQPVQTMMSHLDPNKGSAGAPCLRSMRDPPKEVKDTLASVVGNSANAPKEAWCAAHLNMLCSHALDSYDKYSVIKKSNGDVIQRGFLINYESLPGIVPTVLLPLFGITANKHWLSKMAVESTQYSKGRKSGAKVFTGDSADKEERATSNIQKYAKEILQPNFDRMNEIYTGIIHTFSPLNTPTNEELKIVPTVPVPVKETYYTDALNIIDNGHGLEKSGDNDVGKSASVDGHSAFDKLLTREYLPWIPFSNVHSSKPFDKVSCPDVPKSGYPRTYFMSEMTNNWNTDVTDIPPFHYDSLCHFDYQNATDNTKILAYRSAEVPFVVYNIPEVDTVVKNWNNLDYLHKKLGTKNYRTETSKTNHFMYWHSTGKKLRGADGKNWEPPTNIINEQFEKWLEVAVKGQNKTLDDRTHQYFRVSSDMGGNSWLFEELPFFKPKESIFIVKPSEQRGIHCRFGMRSIIAEAHFDGSRNAVVMLGGLRRWILTHPEQCANMHMLPRDHPSGRHSEIDWSKPDPVKFPNWNKIKGNEVILQPGDYLYVPTYWIHYIVSLNVNFQCNTRSGKHDSYDKYIRKCGF